MRINKISPTIYNKQIVNFTSANNTSINRTNPDYINREKFLKMDKLQRMNATNNNNIDVNEQKVLENIKKEIIKRTKEGKFLLDALNFANRELEKNGLKNKYFYWICNNEEYNSSEQKIFDELDLNIWKKLIDKFEVYDRYNSRHTMIFFYKVPETFLFKDLKHFGEKEIPVENIELAYKDVEKLAKAGYGEGQFINEVMFSDGGTSMHNWPEGCWYILPSGKLCSFKWFRKFGYIAEDAQKTIKYCEKELKKTTDPKRIQELQDWKNREIKTLKKYGPELEPGFVDKYLKAWKEEMLKVNRMGLDRYRYEKYGRTH